MDYMSRNASATEGDSIVSYHGSTGNQVIFRVLTVRNLDERVNAWDLSKLFGFDQTNYLKKFTCVEIKYDGEDKFAKVICPDVSYNELLRLNGIEFFERNLIIRGDDDDVEEDATKQPGDEAAGTPEQEAEIMFMLLDCRNHPDLNFDPVKESEVCEALHIDHADDPLKAVKTYHANRKGTFGIQSPDMTRYVVY